MDEIWKDVVGYEGLYEVSNLGRVKRLSKTVHMKCVDKREGRRSQGEYTQSRVFPDKILKGTLSDKGYLTVGLTKDGKQKNFRIHRLVAIAFIPNPHNKQEVNHKNGIKDDNRVDNLEWSTGDENIKHAIENGLITGVNHSNLSEEDKQWILDNVKIGCREFGVLPIARKFKVRTDVIRRIIRNNS